MKRKIRRIKRKLKNSNKLFLKILILLIILVLIIFIIFEQTIIKDKNEFDSLLKETNIIKENISIDKFNINNIKELKNNNITKTKENLLLEEAIEEYSIDYGDIIDKTIKSIKDEKYANLLIATNYQADAPAFTNSQKYKEEKNKEIDNNKQELDKIIDKTYYLKYIKEKTKDKKTIERYKVLIKNIINNDDYELLNKDITDLKEILKVSNEIFIYLGRNANSWHIENNEIVFTNQEVKTEYEKAIAKIKR